MTLVILRDIDDTLDTEASLGANAPDYSYPLLLVFGIELLATAMLMGVIYLVVYTNGLRRLGSIAIGGMVSLDIFFLAFISGASMNPTRSLAPALFSGILDNLGSIGLQLSLEVLQSPVSFAESSRMPRENS